METPNHTFRRSASGLGLFYGWFGAMHSRLDVIIAGCEEGECRQLLDSMFARTAHLEKRLNRFDPGSDLWQINNLGRGVVPVDDEMIDILAGAAHYKTLTLGAFDIAVHSRDYDPKAEYLDIDFENFLLNVTAEGVTLDMGGYAKGLALEDMVGILREGGVESALISFGNSSVYGLGQHPIGQPWSVGVEQTAGLTGGGIAFELTDCAMSSSGNNNSNRGHIISPYDLRPVTDSRIVSVSGPSPLDCEVLSTALFVAASQHEQDHGQPSNGLCTGGDAAAETDSPDYGHADNGHRTEHRGTGQRECGKAHTGNDAGQNRVQAILANFDMRRAVNISIDGHRAAVSELQVKQ